MLGVGAASFTMVRASGEWPADSEDEFNYTYTEWHEGVVIANGTATLVIEGQSSGVMTYYFTFQLSVDADNLSGNVGGVTQTTSGEFKFMKTRTVFEAFKAGISDTVEEQNTFITENDYTGEAISLDYGYEYSYTTPQGNETYRKILFDDHGILEHREIYSIEDGKKTGEEIIRQHESAIPGLPLPIFFSILSFSIGILVFTQEKRRGN